MGRVRRFSATVASAAVLAGCALLSGAGDLTVADPAGGDTEAGAVELDGATGSDGSAVGVDGSMPSTDGAIGDANRGDGGTRLRDVTFEDGALVGIHGGDSVFGSPVLATGASAIAGNDSMRADKGTGGMSGIQVGFAPVDELFAVTMIRLETVAVAGATLLALDPEPGGLVVEVRVSGANGPLLLAVGGNVVDSGGNVVDQTQGRLGIHVRQDASSSFIEVFLSLGTAAFGSPVISLPTAKTGRTTTVRLGVIQSGGGGLTRAIFDNLFLDTLAMPAF
ncbi:MAG: hypothetical protein QOI41_4284 [Myxococcales bacterium]|nr:hypothetical protein [Myxococcales bacterium]